jgi:peroxiredoxin
MCCVDRVKSQSKADVSKIIYYGFLNIVSSQNNLPIDFLLSIPSDLPVPIDDGACAHLEGQKLPQIELLSMIDVLVNPSQILGWLVIFCYPMTGRPGRALPKGWINVPGAAGCTPQSCSFRDRYDELRDMGCTVLGLSTQSCEDQAEAVNRLNLPYPLFSDAAFQFSDSLKLPMLNIENLRLIKRLTLIAKDGVIKKCFYPVFPPDKNPEEVIKWFSNNT